MYNESKHDSEGLIMITHQFLYVTWQKSFKGEHWQRAPL